MPAIPFFSLPASLPDMCKSPLDMTCNGGQGTDSAGDFGILLQQEVDASETLTPLQAAFMMPAPVLNNDLDLPPAGQTDSAPDKTLASLSDTPNPAILPVSLPYAPILPAQSEVGQVSGSEAPADLQLLQQQRQWQPVLQSRQVVEKPAASLTPLQTAPASAPLTPLGGDLAEELPMGPVLPVQPLTSAAQAQDPSAELNPLVTEPAHVEGDDLQSALASAMTEEEGADGEQETAPSLGESDDSQESGVVENSLESVFAEGAVDKIADGGHMDNAELRVEHAANEVKTHNTKHQPQPNNLATPNKFDSPLNAKVQDDAFSGQISERLVLMVKGDVQSARIQLDPPELGALEVKIKIQHEQMTVTFNSGNAQVRDALEGQGNKLRELLAQQGFNLSDLQVGSQSAGQQQGQQANADQQSQGQVNGAELAEGDEDPFAEDAGNMAPLAIKIPGRNASVDHFA